MQTVEIARHILKQQRRRTRLTSVVALLEKFGVSVGVAPFDAHARIPIVGNACKIRVERRTQAADQVGQRIFEVAVLALAESVARHVNMASEVLFLRVEPGDLTAFVPRQQFFEHRAAVAVQFPRKRLPIILGDARFGGPDSGRLSRSQAWRRSQPELLFRW